jgi:hypothetical protein
VGWSMRAGAGREGRGAPDDKEAQRAEDEVGSENTPIRWQGVLVVVVVVVAVC